MQDNSYKDSCISPTAKLCKKRFNSYKPPLDFGMRNWRVYENEEQTYVMVDESLPKQQIIVNGEECFGGMSISDQLAQRLVKKFGAYCFDLDGMHVIEPEPTVYRAAA